MSKRYLLRVAVKNNFTDLPASQVLRFDNLGQINLDYLLQEMVDEGFLTDYEQKVKYEIKKIPLLKKDYEEKKKVDRNF